MRICYIAGIGSLHTQRWVRYFANQGHDVHVITLGSSEVNTIKDVRLHELKSIRPQIRFISYGANLLFYAIQVRKLLREIKPDIIHTHYITFWGFLGMLSGFHPFVLTAWGSDVLIDPKHNPIWRILTKYTLARADSITCDGNNLRKALTELGAEPQKIYRVLWGVDTGNFNPEQRSEKIREDLGVSSSPMIISSKNLRLVYDIESLVKSIPLVLKKVPEAEFVIAGSGPQEAELKQLAESLSVSDNVKFIGSIPSDEYPKYLASADIYVCTSLSDGGLAISTKEAMSCELPVVITNLEVNAEWIQNGENGFLVPPKDPKTLAEKILHLSEHEDVRMRFGKAGRKLVKERFEYNKEMQKVEKLYRQLIRTHKK